MMQIYVDADACPVKEEALKVAARYQAPIHFVSNSWMRLPEHPLVARVMVPEGPDAADDWIAARASAADIVVTQDIPLASRCLKAGARVIGNTGRPYTDASIGMALAMRELNQHLRETSAGGSFNAGFTRADRSRFLEAMEAAAQSILRAR